MIAIKKILIALIMLFALTPTTYADDGTLNLNEFKFYMSDTNLSGGTDVTDKILAGSLPFGYGTVTRYSPQYLYIKLGNNSFVNIEKIIFTISYANAGVTLYDADLKPIKVTGGGHQSYANRLVDLDVNVNNVHAISFSFSFDNYGGGVSIKGLSINGSLTDLTHNREKEKFVINNLNHQISEKKLLFTWNTIDSVYFQKYKILMNGMESYVTTNSFKFNGDLVEGASYKISVSPVDIFDEIFNGAESLYTVPIIPPDTTPPAKPTNLKAQMSVDYKGIDVSWTANKESDLAGYNLYLIDNGGAEKKLNSSLLKTNIYTLSSITLDNIYEFRLEAVDVTGNVSGSAKTTIKATGKPPVTDSDQNNTPEYILVTWAPTEGAVGYLIYLNGKQVGSVGAETFEYKITKAMGYKPDNLANVTLVKAKFADGSTGGGNNNTKPTLPGGGWGFGGPDIWKDIVLIVGSLAMFIIVRMCIKIVPKIIRIIYSVFQKARSY